MAAKCGAKLRNKTKFCANPAGFKTPHLGEGRCYLHGGLTPVRTGRYSKLKGRLSHLLVDLENHDQNVLDLEPEARMLRAMVIDYVERYEETNEKLDVWYREYQKGNKSAPLPRKPLELHDAQQLVEGVSRIVERIHKITREGSITLEVFRHIMSQMGTTVAAHVSDEKILAKIEKDWNQIMVNPRAFGPQHQESATGE